MADCNCADRERHDWFPMEAGAFLSSATVRDCAPWERQAFLYMLVTSWNDCGLPSDHKSLGRMLGLSEEKVSELMVGPVGDKWEACPHCGTLSNPNLEAVREESTERRDAKRTAGQKGGKASAKRRSKSKQTSSTAEAEPEQRSSTPQAVLGKTQAVLKHTSSSAQANPSTVQDITVQDKTSNAVPEGANAPAPPAAPPRKSKRVDGKLELTKALAKFPCLDPRVVQTAKFVREYRVKRRQPAFDESDWVKHLAEAQHHPEAFAAAAADMDKFKWLSFHIEKHIRQEGQAVAANGQSMRGMSFRTQDEALKAHRNAEIEAWIREGEEGAA